MRWFFFELLVHAILGLLVVFGRKRFNSEFILQKGYIGWFFLFPFTLLIFAALTFVFPAEGIDVWDSPQNAFFWLGFLGLVLSIITPVGFKLMASAEQKKNDQPDRPAQNVCKEETKRA